MLFPFRKTNKISQSFNDGVVTIFFVVNKARAGYAPKECLKEKCTLRFDEQRLGINRYYQSLQNQIEISRVIRVPKAEINTQDVAFIGCEKYRIDMVQKVDEIFPPCLDLTLSKIEQEDCGEIL